ncbi:Membrane protein involved in the export of O-antigen and teichoic acid [Pseudomonas linyingensis]|uniref:Membrane protein involved in the export of O-antigen and teichoic acid n=1 Tax=Pseudomonas linyingensis TaxID=915471 RepID=A0A1H6TZF3_9PSED|nr:flippase [Pseudomonas linyingensis]SEI82637.1 Membrane protein involved in the export of O-antigen and teichoic acid [Pseudomonas linyingensis]
MKLIRSSAYNLLGLGLPLVVAVFCIPVLIDGLGEARFGLLTLIWAVVSYFGLFDLGLGRALTQQLSVALAEKDQDRIGPLVMTSTVLMAGLGIVAGAVLAILAPYGVGMINSVPNKQEAISAVLYMAAAMPAIVLTSGFRGILEAKNAFGVINLIRLPMGLFTFLGPVVVVLNVGPSLEWIAAVLVGGRIIACAVHAWYAWLCIPKDHGNFAFCLKLLRPLCVSGGWLTVSNIISPLMSFVDRFVIGVLVSSSAVAYYSTPQEMVTKLGIVPGALTSALFPRFSAHFAMPQSDFRLIYFKSLLGLFGVLFFPVIFVSVWAKEVMVAWISLEFAENSASLLVVFVWGMFAACLAAIPFTVIQSAGNARLTATLHIFEFPIFVGMLFVFIEWYGVLGAALAWAARNIIDAFLLFYYARRYVSTGHGCSSCGSA